MPSRRIDTKKAEALARWEAAHGLGPQDPKVTRLKRPAAPASTAQRESAGRRHRPTTPEERMAETMERLNLKPLQAADNLPPYDVTRATRYPAVPWTEADGVRKLELIKSRYAFAMREQRITAGDFKSWREHFMFLTVEQAADLVRVTPRTIRNWESGKSEIPFAMWWVMHTTMQDPEYFLTRPGFHDFHIEHIEGEPFLCSSTYPDIRYSPSDLHLNRSALSQLYDLRAEIQRQAARLDEMTAENTRLRQALKAKGLTHELQAMHDHLSSLMKKLATADVVEFPGVAVEAPDEVIPLKQATA
ncbi:hypothetical protein B0G57_1466 [Trinickia symbiotica]|uniref:helix-turn-helix domain-containing protein n=1 Tax=Trinickia symbiotica TaxID=863227 RepID=UPI000CECB515|nr:helix-turn-helix domain-containing protein [Trinickia symbiotica]PPK41027.1 hypothetical protein B0G57_1466 [Trinickia symbiotica]